MSLTIARQIDFAVRTLALVAFGAALVVVITHWAVRRKLLQPFGGWPRLVRRTGDPLLQPIERRLASSGGNPADAPYWLLGLVVVAGLLLMTLVRWVTGSIELAIALRGAGPLVWIRVLVGAATSLVMAAIVVRVIGLWLGAGRYNRWVRPAYWLTDWIIEPVRRRMPPMGALDLGPIVAYLLLLVARMLLLALLP
jgi:MYXO-CTERM domain-containing protein